MSATTDTLVRTKVTWGRWCPKRMKMVTSHPTLWVWTDAEGVERTFDSKAEAVAAMTEFGL